MTLGFRRRLLLTSMATLAVGLGALLVIGNVLLDRRVEAEASSVLAANADAQVSALDVTSSGVRVRDTANDAALDQRGWVFDRDRVLERPPNADPALEAQVLALGRERRAVDVNGPDDTRIRAVPLIPTGGSQPVGAIVVVSSTETLEQLQTSVLAGSVVLAFLILVGGGLALRSVIDRALRPVVQMTTAASSWSATDLDRRFALGAPTDELTGLAATLDGLLDRIAASRRHEQRFAADVAHELRTPLAGLRGRAELALGGTEAERVTALKSAVLQADRLSTAIDTLLAVARQDLNPAEGSVDLETLARSFEGVELVIADGATGSVEGDPEVVARALTPLVENARRHARSRVWFELGREGRRVTLAVCDDGPGPPPELGDRIFDPGVRGAGEGGSGAGLGLPLAQRLARSCGGEIRSAQADGGRFVLDLPAVG